MTEKNDRNWLIRTRSMQILGPISHAKVLELLDKGSLKEDDELTSGNGYWFTIKEKDLLEKYVFHQVAQTFNPISEAPSVLTVQTAAPIVEDVIAAPEPVEAAKPAEEDLEYPEVDDLKDLILNDEEEDKTLTSPTLTTPTIEIETHQQTAELPALNLEEDDDEEERDDVTLVASTHDLTQTQIQEKKPALKIEPKIEAKTEVKVEVESHPEAIVRTIETKKPVVEEKPKKKKTKKLKKLTKNDSYLFVLLFLFVVMVLGIVYYYRTILNKPLPGFETTSLFFPSAHAQILTTASVKKKALID